MSDQDDYKSVRVKSNVDIDMEKYVDSLLENKDYVRDAIKNRNAENYRKKLIIDHLKMTYTELEDRYDSLLEEYMKYQKEYDRYKEDLNLCKHELSTCIDSKMGLEDNYDMLVQKYNDLQFEFEKLKQSDYYSGLQKIIKKVPGILGVILSVIISPGVFKYSMGLIFFINVGYFIFTLGKYIDLKFFLEIIKGLL